MSADLERLFRLEASELVEALEQGLLELEKAGERTDLIAQCYRFAHTLKGAARTVRRTDLSELAHAMEEALAPYRESGDPIEQDCVSDLLKLLKVIRAELQQPTAAPQEKGQARSPRSAGSSGAPVLDADRFETVRVELSDMDTLLSSLSEARMQLRGLRALHEQLGRAQRAVAELLEPLSKGAPERGAAATRTVEPTLISAAQRQRAWAALDELRGVLLHTPRDLSARLERAEQELAQAHERVGTLRLVRVGALFPSLELAARDAAQLLGKQVELECFGGDIRVEANILSAVRDALLHMVRNAVDHGVEPPEVRQQRGKDPIGHVRVRAERRGRRVAFLCSDDGGGIDVDAVREAALLRRSISQSEALRLGPSEALQLIFRAGVSTSREVTEVSGRGVGLDIVREAAARFNGEVSVSSEPGAGSTIGMSVPTALAALTALVVSVSGTQVLLPLDAVRSTLRLAHTDIIKQPDGDSILYEGRVVPFLPLGPLLGREAAAQARWSVLIAQAGSELLALGADRLEGTLELTVKPLPPEVGAQPLVAGAALDAEGNPLLVLDLRGVLAAHRGGAGTALRAEVAPARLPILVIDDSLTTRTLEQSVLEVAGYKVDLASSAEEGLSKARAKSYGLFIVDVEMPGMNGFEFTALTRADATLSQVPVILVTSLSTPEHRRRGLEVGASSYIVKSEFNQGQFLQRVMELLR